MTELTGHSPVAVAIVGAGAAGIAAGRVLTQAGVDTILLEARERIGGRAWTVGHGVGVRRVPLDLGCGWLHSADRNPWRAIAEETGFTVDRTRSPWGEQYRELGFSKADQADFHRASEAFYERVEAAADDAVDRPAAACLEPGERWAPLLNAVSTYVNGVELAGLSVHDYARYADSGLNWRVGEGYGALIAAYGAALPVRLRCPVELIDHTGGMIRLQTPEGSIHARQVIVTVPPTLMATEALRFAPALPEKLEAANGLPLGLANKLFLEVLSPLWDVDAHVLGRVDRQGTGSYLLCPLRRPIIEAYYGGELARELEAGGLAAFTAFALEELAGLLGGDIRKALKPVISTAWHGDRFSLGSYSHAWPGHADDHVRLAEPVDGRLHFAGEACSRHDYSTAHGAYLTGVAAANAVLHAIGAAPRTS